MEAVAAQFTQDMEIWWRDGSLAETTKTDGLGNDKGISTVVLIHATQSIGLYGVDDMDG